MKFELIWLEVGTNNIAIYDWLKFVWKYVVFWKVLSQLKQTLMIETKTLEDQRSIDKNVKAKPKPKEKF